MFYKPVSNNFLKAFLVFKHGFHVFLITNCYSIVSQLYKINFYAFVYDTHMRPTIKIIILLISLKNILIHKFIHIYIITSMSFRNGEKFIYAVLDWRKPGRTILICFGILLLLVVIHILVCCIYYLRRTVYRKIYKNIPQNNTNTNVLSGCENKTINCDNVV